ncbi:unnamed protein product, partial [Phaeothamnion confervicola]
MVYVRANEVPLLLPGRAAVDMPPPLFERLDKAEEALRLERQARMNLFVTVSREQDVRDFQFDSAGNEDFADWPTLPSFKIGKHERVIDLLAVVCKELRLSPAACRPWLCTMRENQTCRPSDPLEGDLLLKTVEAAFAGQGKEPRLYLETVPADRRCAVRADGTGGSGKGEGGASKRGNATLLPAQKQYALLMKGGAYEPVVEGECLIFLKHYDPSTSAADARLRLVGTTLLHAAEKCTRLLRPARRLAGLPEHKKLRIYEQITPRKIEEIDLRQTVTWNELQHGDIVCFQVEAPGLHPTLPPANGAAVLALTAAAGGVGNGGGAGAGAGPDD